MRDMLLASDSQDQLFKPIQTMPIAGLVLFGNVAVLIAAFTLPTIYESSTQIPSIFAVLLYLQCVLWTFCVLADFLISKHHQKSQLRGYLDFNRKIIPWARASLISVTGCSILLLLIAALSWDYCPREGTCSVAAPLTPAHYVQVVLSLQTCILLPVCLSYIVRIHQFNKQRSLPDIFEGQMVYSLPRSLPTFEEVGVRDNSADTLLEKQAEAIHFLREHNARLSRKILSLTDQLGRFSEPVV